MAFKLTYTDGQESDYDDDTKWELDDGVLKLGRGDGGWTVLVSPGHWATIELGKSAKGKKQKKDDGDKSGDDKADKKAEDDADDAEDDDS